MINETASYTLLQAHQTTTVPAVIILYVASIIISLIVGLSLVKTKEARGKIVLITVVSAIFVGLVVLGLCLMPETIQTIGGLFK